MRIYEVKNASGNTVSFVRSFDQAKVIVKQDSPSAKKVYSNNEVPEYSSCFVILAVDIKTDKEGIISKLNSLLEQKPDSPEEPEEKRYPELKHHYEMNEALEPKTPLGISPAIEFTGNGQGTCLHCNKTVGYVGGFPRVNPPVEILDK